MRLFPQATAASKGPSPIYVSAKSNDLRQMAQELNDTLSQSRARPQPAAHLILTQQYMPNTPGPGQSTSAGGSSPLQWTNAAPAVAQTAGPPTAGTAPLSGGLAGQCIAHAAQRGGAAACVRAAFGAARPGLRGPADVAAARP